MRGQTHLSKNRGPDQQHSPARAAAYLGAMTAAIVLLGGGCRHATMESAGDRRLSIRFDATAATALTDALDRRSLTDTDVAALLRIPGVGAMVDNTVKYVPSLSRGAFRSALEHFVATRVPPSDTSAASAFDLAGVYASRSVTRSLLERLRTDEPLIAARMRTVLERYRPVGPPVAVTIYLVAGGASDGFVVDGTGEPSLFVAVDKAHGDLPGLVQNTTHELYHVLQRASASADPRAAAAVNNPQTLSPPLRLLELTTLEGTANFVVDPTASAAHGPYIDMWRARYERNASAGRIRDNFALFDSVLAGVRRGTLPWSRADSIGFSGDNDARFYFVGSEMARTLVDRYGAGYLDSLFRQPPWRLAADYSAYCRTATCPARFDDETGRWLAQLRRAPTSPRDSSVTTRASDAHGQA